MRKRHITTQPSNKNGSSAAEEIATSLTGLIKTASQVESSDDTKEVTGLISADYTEALRRHLSRWEISEILSEGRKSVWPTLNKSAVRLVARDEFVRLWSAFGLQFKFSQLEGEDGLSLLGFYSKDRGLVGQKPLIWVNTAHHPSIIGAALAHEMGHHIVSQMFGVDGSTPQFLERSGFVDHLKEPAELAADVLVSLGIYPNSVARKLFDSRSSAQRRSVAENVDFNKILSYVAKTYRLNFDAQLEQGPKFYALAALIYYTQLRRALLDEFDL